MPSTHAAHAGDNWELELANLLNDLSDVQSELFEVLEAKRIRLANGDAAGADELRQRTQQLLARLQSCQDRRSRLLNESAQQGYPAATLGKLAMRATKGSRDNLARQVKDASSRMRLVHQQSLSNWVLAQRTLLHISQMLEIIATGGRLQPTYGNGGGETPSTGGALVDHAA
jgi:hypothetical protein